MVQKKFNLVSPVTSKEADARSSQSKNESIELITKIVGNTNQIQDETIVIKLTSKVIANESLLQNFVSNIHLLDSCGANIIIIHDYSGLISSSLSSIGFEEKLVNGLNVADFKMSQIIEMAVSGYINKKLVSALCSEDCNAIGISGKDANLIEAKQIQVTKSRKLDGVIDLGFIGEPILVNPEILGSFEEANLVTVISPIAFSRNKSTYLLDVDMTASIIASAMTAKHLIIMSKLDRIKCDDTDMSQIKTSQIKRMVNQEKYEDVASALNASYSGYENGIENVYLIDENEKDSILNSIFLTKKLIKVNGH